MTDYTNTDREKAIDEYIHSAKYREILKEKLIDGLTYAEIAERHGMSDRHAWQIVCKYKNILFSRLS